MLVSQQVPLNHLLNAHVCSVSRAGLSDLGKGEAHKKRQVATAGIVGIAQILSLVVLTVWALYFFGGPPPSSQRNHIRTLHIAYKYPALV